MNVLITGAAGGLGRAMAVECGKRGYDLYPRRAQTDALLARRRAPAHVGGRDRQLAVENGTGKMAECVTLQTNPTPLRGLFEGIAARRSALADARTFASREVFLPTHMSPAKMI